MDIEKMYEEYTRLMEELGRTNLDDPNRPKLLDEAEQLGKLIAEYEKRDQDRLNANAQNDIREESVRVDLAKVKADRTRTWVDAATKLLSIGAGMFGVWYSYQKEEVDFTLPCRAAMDFAKNLFRR